MRRFAHALPFVITIVSAKGASQPGLVQTFLRLLLSELQAVKLKIDQRLAAPATGNRHPADPARSGAWPHRFRPGFSRAFPG
ncbi:hypothetical protein [Breoghania sp. JC706]|uniref:hypothetical protein n=1 Tax=Breoghania sp. JC706 TaxID=3117732 RepID=UPI00300B9BCD